MIRAKMFSRCAVLLIPLILASGCSAQPASVANKQAASSSPVDAANPMIAQKAEYVLFQDIYDTSKLFSGQLLNKDLETLTPDYIRKFKTSVDTKMKKIRDDYNAAANMKDASQVQLPLLQKAYDKLKEMDDNLSSFTNTPEHKQKLLSDWNTVHNYTNQYLANDHND